MKIVLAAEQNEICVVLKFMNKITYVAAVPCRTTESMGEILATVQVSSTTAQTDGAQRTASPPSIETSGAPMPTQ